MAARLFAASRQGLDVDEIFSLAMATGHSVEHALDKANPVRGDFIAAESPRTAGEYRRFIQHDEKAAGMPRVVRAVFLSDTNPPLYYMALNLWTRLTGTGDFAIRFLSILLSAVCVALVFLLARDLQGRRTGLIAAFLFALAPQAVFYGSLARMYSLLSVCVVAAGIMTVRVRREPTTAKLALWIAVSATGLLTHYFFAFPWLAMCAWLTLDQGRLSRLRILASSTAVLIAVAPWYLRIPESLDGWRVTKGWLETRPEGFDPIVAPLRLIAGYVLVGGDWLDRRGMTDYLLIATFAAVFATALVVSRSAWRSRSTRLLAGWLFVSIGGLLVFDVLQHTYARSHSRYAFAALPAAIILVAMALARLPVRIRMVATGAIMLLWIGGLVRLNREPRGDNPFKRVASLIDPGGTRDRVVVVHAIPSGVLGIARYVNRDTRMLDWVEAHRSRTPEKDAAGLAGTFRRVTLVKSPPTHRVPEEEAYFRSRATAIRTLRARGFEKIEFEFAPRSE